jgi:hypothetical protein
MVLRDQSWLGVNNVVSEIYAHRDVCRDGNRRSALLERVGILGRG